MSTWDDDESDDLTIAEMVLASSIIVIVGLLTLLTIGLALWGLWELVLWIREVR